VKEGYSKMSKSTALTARDSHHFINVTPPILSTDSKIAKKQLALWRRQIRTAKEERWMDAAREVGVEAIRGIGGEIGNIGRGVADAHGQMFRGWLSNTDPITWAAGGVAVVVYITFLANMARAIGKTLGISQDLAADIGLNYLTDNLPTAVNQTISTIVGRDDKNGLYGVGHLSADSLTYTEIYWYTNTASRDAALIALHFKWVFLEAVDKVPAPGGTYSIPSTKAAQALNRGRWVAIWTNPPPSANVGTSVPIGFFDDQALATAAALAYMASLPDRTVIVQMA
jgi:hypothetical protein